MHHVLNHNLNYDDNIDIIYISRNYVRMLYNFIFFLIDAYTIFRYLN